MFKYQRGQYRNLVGIHDARISGIQVEPNKFYDPTKENSTEENLSITFILTDKETLEDFTFTQKFVSPLTGGNYLFQQLLDACGVMEDAEEGVFDEDKFNGRMVQIVIEKDKKNYDRVKTISALPEEKSKNPKKK